MDVGEGTYGQLERLFGSTKLEHNVFALLSKLALTSNLDTNQFESNMDLAYARRPSSWNNQSPSKASPSSSAFNSSLFTFQFSFRILKFIAKIL